MTKAALGLVALLGALVFGVAGGASVYSERRAEILELQQAIAATWQAADAKIEQRSELVPRLIEQVRLFATREREAIKQASEARKELERAFAVPERIKANDKLSATLSQLVKIAETYPELRAKPQYERLQDELAAIENQAAAERRKYNQAVQAYNTRLQLFPSNLVAAFEGFEREEAYFRTSEQARQAEPAVPFSQTPKATEASEAPETPEP